MLKIMKKQAITLSAITLSLVAASAFAAAWQVSYSHGSQYAPSPYNYTNTLGCTWNYTNTYGGNWGVQHNYTANGSCTYSEQKVNFSTYGRTTTVSHR